MICITLLLIMAEIIKSGRTSYLQTDRFLLYKHSHNKMVNYWRCKRQGQCLEQLKQTMIELHFQFVVTHLNIIYIPLQKVIEVLRLSIGIKKKAAEHLEVPPYSRKKNCSNTISSKDMESTRGCTPQYFVRTNKCSEGWQLFSSCC